MINVRLTINLICINGTLFDAILIEYMQTNAYKEMMSKCGSSALLNCNRPFGEQQVTVSRFHFSQCSIQLIKKNFRQLPEIIVKKINILLTFNLTIELVTN